jgi:TP53 regulating kinase and related kinases
MTRVRKSGVHTPYLVLVDEINRNIYMQFITNSISVKLFLWNIFNSHKTFELKIVQTLAHEMGKTVAQIHNADVIHGDFTTSNFLLKPK